MKRIILESINPKVLFEHCGHCDENVEEGNISDEIDNITVDAIRSKTPKVSPKRILAGRQAARTATAKQLKGWKKGEPKTYRAARKLSTEKDSKHPSKYSAKQNKTIKRIEDTAEKAAEKASGQKV